jgi:hypothetical protein
MVVPGFAAEEIGHRAAGSGSTTIAIAIRRSSGREIDLEE